MSKTNITDYVNKFSDKKTSWSSEVVTLIVFVVGYIFLRIGSKFIENYIPEWIRTEIRTLYSWGPVLIPILFGLTYRKKTKTETDLTWDKLFGKKKPRRRFSPDEKRVVGARQNWNCNICQKRLPASFEVDHVQPLWNGGEDQLNNMQALCPNCHGNKTLKERMKMCFR